MSSVRVDISQIEGLERNLRRLSGEQFGLAAAEAVNEVITRADAESRRGMNAGINLTDAYVRGKTDLALAPAGANPEATLTTRGDLTILGHYDPVVTYVAASRAKGDPSRGVPAGSKAAGVSVEIRRGGRKPMPGAFTMRLRRGTADGDQTGVFFREGARKRHVYGVAPYSLFRYQIGVRQDDFAADLERTAAEKFADAIDKVL